MPAEPFAYDAVVYRTLAQSQVHPDRLAAIALLYGVDPIPVEHCRVLEIGCGDGSNLVPMAAALPKSDFVGFDLSGAAIARAQRFITDCGLRNISVRQASVTDSTAVSGAFDYILCHGLYSWVPDAARDAILQVCQDHLGSQGLCMISYNALPGGQIRRAAREMLRWHTRHETNPADQLQQARALAKFLATATSDQNEAGRALRAEYSALLEKEDGFLYHDDLAAENTPFYLHEFMSAAIRHGLRFVAEAEPGNLLRGNLTGETKRILDTLANNRVEREQYVDFIIARHFRQTILCHQALAVAPEPVIDRLSRGWFSSLARTLTPQAVPVRATEAIFQKPGGPRLTTSFLPGKLALRRLTELAPGRITYAELEACIRSELQQLGCPGEWTADAPGGLQRFLFEAYAPKIVDFHTFHPSVKSVPGAYPQAFPPARIQAGIGSLVTNAYHQVVALEDRWSREALQRMDGTRTRAQLHTELASLVQASGAQADPVWQAVHDDFDAALGRLAKLGLLVG